MPAARARRVRPAVPTRTKIALAASLSELADHRGEQARSSRAERPVAGAAGVGDEQHRLHDAGRGEDAVEAVAVDAGRRAHGERDRAGPGRGVAARRGDPPLPSARADSIERRGPRPLAVQVDARARAAAPLAARLAARVPRQRRRHRQRGQRRSSHVTRRTHRIRIASRAMSRVAAVTAAAFALLAAPAAAQDHAATARNIIPSGQYGAVPPPAGADQQALMYDALTPLFDQVTPADLHDQVQVRALRARRGRAGDASSRCRARASRSCATASTCRTSPASRATT